MYRKDFPFKIVLHDVEEETNKMVSFQDFLYLLDKYRECKPDPEPKK